MATSVKFAVLHFQFDAGCMRKALIFVPSGRRTMDLTKYQMSYACAPIITLCLTAARSFEIHNEPVKPVVASPAGRIQNGRKIDRPEPAVRTPTSILAQPHPAIRTYIAQGPSRACTTLWLSSIPARCDNLRPPRARWSPASAASSAECGWPCVATCGRGRFAALPWPPPGSACPLRWVESAPTAHGGADRG